MKGRTGWMWARWLLLYALVTALFSQFAMLPEIRIAHGVLVYMLLVIGASREGGRWLSGTMVVLSYLAVDWFFVPPRRAFGRPSEFDFIILIGFLVTATVISQLVVHLRQAATLANARSLEIETLSAERVRFERSAARADVLREAERLKDALIASLIHDLRSPITTMTMLSDPDALVPPRMALQRIADEVHRIDSFLSALGRFTASPSSERLLQVEPHVVEDLIGTAIRSTEGKLSGHDVRTGSESDADELLMVRCDFTLSLRILGNLLENAARYSPVNTPIDVIAERDGAQVRITVADRGAGMRPDELERVFLPLQRGSAADMAHSGSGMGLAIARTFAQAQLGNVVYADRIGGGAQFSLLLPYADPLMLPPGAATNSGGISH